MSDAYTVTAVGSGEAIITATAGEKSSTCTVSVDILFVDLELPSGLKWAKYNLCETGFVTNPASYGDYYAWGETETYYYYYDSVYRIWKKGKSDGYEWSSYKWCNGSYNTLTKYNSMVGYGVVDNKTILDAEDDVAHVKLGGAWRIHTNDDWNELIDNCLLTWVVQNGRTGVKVTSRVNEKSIILPDAGVRLGTNIYYGHSKYWSSISSGGPNAWGVTFSLDDDANLHFYLNDCSRLCNGHNVRPVTN